MERDALILCTKPPWIGFQCRAIITNYKKEKESHFLSLTLILKLDTDMVHMYVSDLSNCVLCSTEVITLQKFGHGFGELELHRS